MERAIEANGSGDAVALTARWIAAARAHESARMSRLFYDPFAEALARVDAFSSPQSDRRLRIVSSLLDSLILQTLRVFGSSYLAIRTRFFDDLLLHAVHVAGVRQVVVLAAGLDTRALRLPWPPGTHVYELDRPEVLRTKEKVLMTSGAPVSHNRHALGVDLTYSSWGQELRAAGYNSEQPSAWLIEGLLMYLNDTEVRELLSMVTDLVLPGSWLGADMVNAAFLTSPFSRPWIRMASAHGAPWRFGTNAPAMLFASLGWETTVTQPGEKGAHYRRWPFGVASRVFPTAPRMFLVAAQRSALSERKNI